MSGFGQGDAQVPKDLPNVLQVVRPQLGAGRGFGRGSYAVPNTIRPGSVSAADVAGKGMNSSFPPTVTLGQAQPIVNNEKPPGYVPFKQALWNANQPLRELEELDKLTKSYIPGLHIPGQNFPSIPAPPSKAHTRIEIPPELIRVYRSGTKHPVSAMEEFSKKLKVQLSFKETAVEDPSLCRLGMFGNTCYVEGHSYPQGVGKTKKDAKTQAARNAFDMILKDGISIVKDDGVGGNDGGTDDGSEVGEFCQPHLFNAQKTPSSMLNEYCSKKNIQPNISLSHVPTSLGFECEVKIEGKLIAKGYGTTKKDAKNQACDEALRVLISSSSVENKETHFNKMAGLAKKKLEELQKMYKLRISDYSVLAAFIVIQFSGDEGRVVALATGNGCPKSHLLKMDGKVLIDCHAEVLARRALVKWFVKQLIDAVNSLQRGLPNDSIFEPCGTGNKYCLKESVSIHFYISAAPCGDASAYNIDTQSIISCNESEAMFSGSHFPKFESNDHGVLRTKGDEAGQITVDVSKTLDCKLDTDTYIAPIQFRTMSCSDKILKWNILGLQGSLLSHLLEPVYINSITLGSNYEHGHLVRAVCCRVGDDIKEALPAGYELRHPFVGRISVYEPRPAGTTINRTQCINWCAADNDVEIVSSEDGLAVAESPFHVSSDSKASRLCKYGFGFRFRTLARSTRRQDLVKLFGYNELKEAATDYCIAKKILYEYLHKSALGNWVQRSDGLDAFNF